MKSGFAYRFIEGTNWEKASLHALPEFVGAIALLVDSIDPVGTEEFASFNCLGSGKHPPN